MADRRLLRCSVALLIAAYVVYGVAQAFHADGTGTSEVFAVYANSHSWTAVHEFQFAASALFTFGLLALSFGLNVSSGLLGIMNRFAAASVAATLALSAALYAVDGVALKQASDAWTTAPAAEQPAFFAVVQGIRGVEWGLRGYVDFTTGIALVLFAIVIAATRRIPSAIGYLMGLSGLAYVAQGYGYNTGYTSISPNFVLNSASYQFLVLVWTVWLLIVAVRMKEPATESGG